jgi:hypothetical protein
MCASLFRFSCERFGEPHRLACFYFHYMHTSLLCGFVVFSFRSAFCTAIAVIIYCLSNNFFNTHGIVDRVDY